MSNDLQNSIDTLLNEILKEQFITISNDGLFRVLLNPREGLIKLQQMNHDKSIETIISTTLAACGHTTTEARKRVLRFGGFLNEWKEQFEFRLSREQAIQLFDLIDAIVKIAFEND